MKYLAILALLLLVGCAKRPVKPAPPVVTVQQPKPVRPKKGDFLVHNCKPITGKESTCICARAVTHVDKTDPGMTLECKQ